MKAYATNITFQTQWKNFSGKWMVMKEAFRNQDTKKLNRRPTMWALTMWSWQSSQSTIGHTMVQRVFKENIYW